MRPLKRNDAIFLIIKEKFAKYAFMIFFSLSFVYVKNDTSFAVP